MQRPDRTEVEALIASDPLLCAVRAEVEARADGDTAHDIDHLLRVAVWTLRCGPELDPRSVIAAALLHDIVNVPKNSPDRSRASELCAVEAERLLTELSARDLGERLPPTALRDIHDAIRDHSFSRGATPRGALGRALQDADRLEAVGAIGIMRCLGTGPRIGARYFDPQDPFADHRDLEDTRFSVDHFFTKLLGLSRTLLTPVGRAEAARRSQILKQFIEALAGELERPCNRSLE
ncbi:MAG: HD domain-containing protein [Polyangiaceae bacterium]|nr:HD domain-containing protein [Polyangiaceae bacterium]